MANLFQRASLLASIVVRVVRHTGGISGSVAKAARIVRIEGRAGLFRRFGVLNVYNTDYGRWIAKFDTPGPNFIGMAQREIAAMINPPVISVLLPIDDAAPRYLDAAIKSVRAQLYSHWELCIAADASRNLLIQQLIRRHAAEDARIKFIFCQASGQVSASPNSALDLAAGSYIGLLGQDDLLSPHALFHVARAISRNQQAGLIYSDEDKIGNDGRRSDPHFKPDWNPELFRSQNYINRFAVCKTALVRELGEFRAGFDAAQDYDLVLRVAEKIAPQDIIHIPHVLYHSRIHYNGAAESGDAGPHATIAGERALNDHLSRLGIAGTATAIGYGYRISYDLPVRHPLVSIIIPTRNRHDLVKTCVESIVEKTRYHPYEILLVDNRSDNSESLRYFAALQREGTVKLIRHDDPFNYAAINNNAVEHVGGSIVCLLNNDIEVISSGWLHEMVSLAVQDGNGAVGARLLYPNNTLQHAGVILGIGEVAGHAHLYHPADQPGYFNRARLAQNLSAVTAACLVIRKSIYQEVNGLDPRLPVAFNDVDFCLRVRESGRRNVWTPFAELYHRESVSRGYELTPEKHARFRRDSDYMLIRWGDTLTQDPAYNSNLGLNHSDFSYAWPPRVRAYEIETSVENSGSGITAEHG